MENKLDKAIAALEKEFGRGTIMYADAKPQEIDFISTGSMLLDRAIGGGFPVGRIIEIIGPESSGKTTICLETIVNAQKAGKKAAFIDMEHALSIPYAKALGIEMDKLLISQPMSGEEALNIAKVLVETREVGIIVIDSVAALVPKSEVEGAIGDANVGKQARLMSQTLRMLTPLAEKNGTTIIFANQIRMKIGVMFGSPETPAGGEALKFYASVRLDLRKKVDKEGEGNDTKVKVIKNKIAAPFQEAELFIKWGKGIDVNREIAELAVEQGVLTKSGSWFVEGENRIANGAANFNAFLEDNPEFVESIRSKIKI